MGWTSRERGQDERARAPTALRFDDPPQSAAEHPAVKEFPFPLSVDGKEPSTLVASSRNLHRLAAGFLRTQRLVASAEKIRPHAASPPGNHSSMKETMGKGGQVP